jgi:hypothetical protein
MTDRVKEILKRHRLYQQDPRLRATRSWLRYRRGEHRTGLSRRRADMTKPHQLADLGQAIWLDYIRRSFITSGDLQALVDDGLRGVTSNPTIFEKAIAGSIDYDDALHRLVERKQD